MIPADRETLRSLASQLVEISLDGVQEERRASWRDSNGLRPHRPMIWITEIPWGECREHHDELRPTCEGEAERRMENELRRRLFTQRHLPCDDVEDGRWWVQKQFDSADYGLDVAEEMILQGDSYVRSHQYRPVITEPDDIDKIQFPDVTYNEERTLEDVRISEEALGDVMPVKICGPREHFFSAWDLLVKWTGVTESLFDMFDRPDFIHGIVRRMTDAYILRMKQYEDQGHLDDSNRLVRVGSGAAGMTDHLPPEREGGLRLMDQWAGSTAQILGDVSPEMHQEFALKYETEVMAQCGLNYYGCCEPLHLKMHILAKVPRLRKISISPWCDTSVAAEKAETAYVFSHKPSPAIFAFDRFDIEAAERELRERLANSRGMSCEIIMKDISTVRG